MKKPTGWFEGNDLVLTRRFEAPIDDVWTSITKSESTARWYGSWAGTPGQGNTIKIKMVFEKDGPESEVHIDAREMGPGWEYHLDNLVAARAEDKLPTFDEYYPSMQAHYTDAFLK